MHSNNQERDALQAHGDSGKGDMLAARLITLLLGSVICGHALGQPIGIATDYEWQLKRPGRTLFRDRIPAGQIALVASGGGLFGKKEKASGELLQVLTDIAFVPGDTVRYFAACIRLVDGERIQGEIIADADELPLLLKSARYMSKTATDIAARERAETEIVYRTKAGFSLEFTQVGTTQRLQIAMPDPLSDGEMIRSLTSDQLLILADLIDLTIFELKRQGANIIVAQNSAQP